MLRAVWSRRFLTGWAAGILTVAAIAAGVGLWIVFGGGFDAGASKQHLRPVAWATHTAMRNWVKKQAKDVQAPGPFTAADVKAGAHEYEQHCMACHGGPAVARAKWASAMVPTPPFLIDTSRHWSSAELYVIVHDGIKMTAMPAWGELGPAETIWSVVAFLEAMATMSPGEFAHLREEASGAAAASPGPATNRLSAVPLAP
jgi:mono/diheme cytochrome c family protein